MALVMAYNFTLYVHYYELPRYLFTVVYITHVTNACDQRRSVGSGVANSDPQNIWNPRKKLRIFRGRYIVGTLIIRPILLYSIT